jgi:hypothetical protein
MEIILDEYFFELKDTIFGEYHKDCIVGTPCYVKYYVENNQVFSKHVSVERTLITLNCVSDDKMYQEINNYLFNFDALFSIQIQKELDRYIIYIRGTMCNKRIVELRKMKLEKLDVYQN